MKKWAYMIPIYAYLVRAGKWAISEEDKTEGQKVVPEVYRDDVAAYLAEHAQSACGTSRAAVAIRRLLHLHLKERINIEWDRLHRRPSATAGRVGR